MAPFTLRVKLVSGFTREVTVPSELSVGMLKRRLAALTDAPEDAHLHVAHNGKMLLDDETMASAGVDEAPVVVLAVSTRPLETPPPLPQQQPPQPQQPAPPPVPPPPEPPEEDAQCRICYGGAEAGPLVTPCRCRGTMRFVHAHCLNEWRTSSANANSFNRCDQCGFAYQYRRTTAASLLKHPATAWLATLLALALVTALGATLPFAPERRVYRFLEWYPWRWWGPRCDALVRGLLAPSGYGLFLCVRGQARLHRGVPLDKQYWLAALIVSIAANGPRVFRIFLLCGLPYFSGYTFVFFQTLAKRLLIRWSQLLECSLQMR